MQEIPLQIDLSDYDEEDWEVLWEKLLVNANPPARCESFSSQAAYAYNYANYMIDLLKRKAEENKSDVSEEQ